MNEKELINMRKQNIRLYSIYEVISIDLLFYYGIKILFLSQVKGISEANIVLASSVFALFSVLSQMLVVIFIDKFGAKNTLVTGNVLRVISVIMLVFCQNFVMYLIEEIMYAFAFALKHIAESTTLRKIYTKNT